MKCNKCQFSDTKVIESRDVAEGLSTRRRRQCLKCKARFTTYERLERPQLIVIKHDGSSQLYDRDKLMAGLHRACGKTPVTKLQLETLVSKIENKLYSRGEAEIESAEIGDLILEGLADLSEVAYVRFASVYRRFKDVNEFEKVLEKLRAKSSNS